MEYYDEPSYSDTAQPETVSGANPSASENDSGNPNQSEANKELVTKITDIIRRDKKHHEKAFKRMRRDMHIATHGADKDWSGNYTANITGRHIKTKTSALYAKNPKIVARRRETIDFAVWDENDQSLKIAMGITQMAAQQAMMGQGAAPTMPSLPAPGGMAAPQQSEGVQPQLPMAQPGISQPPQGFEQAQAILADFQQGMERRTQAKKFGKTLETLFTQYMREQKPLDFKEGMKQLVRRALTTGVAYIEVGYQREYGQKPDIQAKLEDARGRLNHLQRLAEEVQEGDITDTDPEMQELQSMMAALQAEPEIVIRQGLVFDYPQATRVIPDRFCKSIVGFVGSQHLTIETIMTKEECEERYKKELGSKYTKYSLGQTQKDGEGGVDYGHTDSNDLRVDNGSSGGSKNPDMVCTWRYFDKTSGLVYHLCEGFDQFLCEPAPPDVYINDFWPIRAITFNACENEEEVFPPSDVSLLIDMQKEYNCSREGKKEHRYAARPRWVYHEGMVEDEDIEKLKAAKPMDAVGIKSDISTPIDKQFQAFPVPGVDPNLYDVNEILSDMQFVAGAQEAQLGATSKSTATESSIAANTTAASDNSSIDDLDAFLSWVARAGGQILMKECNVEDVSRLVGPGAVWPQQTLQDLSDEIFLEIEAGSTGRPNQAVEINNWKNILPFLIQMGSIPPVWLARETLRRLDDKMDLTEAVVEGLPSIVAMNAMSTAAPAPAANGEPNNPEEQGEKGKNNTPAPPGEPAGTDAAMGDNRSTPGVIRYGVRGERV